MEPASLGVTRLAILRTIGTLHAEPLQYDLELLRALIVDLEPDLLCADIMRTKWERGDVSSASVEVREALAPIVGLTDTVLVPIGPSPERFADYGSAPGVRGWLSARFERLLQAGLRRANTVQAVHGPAFGAFCHAVCALEAMIWTERDRAAYRNRSEALAGNVMAAVKRDPGRRVLVAIQCQWDHILESQLRQKAPWLQIVEYQNL